MEEKTITLKELEAYIGIASFYIAEEQHLNDVESATLARLARDFYTHIYDHVTGKNPFDQERLDHFFKVQARMDFIEKLLGGGTAMKTVKVTTDNIVSIIDVDFDNYKDIQRAIGGGHFETVHTTRMQTVFEDESLIMIVDESGRLKNLPENMLGSVLYGTARHGNPIVGDIIFAKISGENIVGPDDPEGLMQTMFRYFVGLKEVD